MRIVETVAVVGREIVEASDAARVSHSFEVSTTTRPVLMIANMDGSGEQELVRRKRPEYISPGPNDAQPNPGV